MAASAFPRQSPAGVRRSAERNQFYFLEVTLLLRAHVLTPAHSRRFLMSTAPLSECRLVSCRPSQTHAMTRPAPRTRVKTACCQRRARQLRSSAPCTPRPSLISLTPHPLFPAAASGLRVPSPSCVTLSTNRSLSPPTRCYARTHTHTSHARATQGRELAHSQRAPQAAAA